jgi:hypothetical protein
MESWQSGGFGRYNTVPVGGLSECLRRIAETTDLVPDRGSAREGKTAWLEH